MPRPASETSEFDRQVRLVEEEFKMTDIELLTMAAKAAGIRHTHRSATDAGIYHDGAAWWNPLVDDVDAFRLAVKLNISINRPVKGDSHFGTWATTFDTEISIKEHDGADPMAASRRAIVRAAAELGLAGMDMEQNENPPELKPCPFCGKALNVRWRKSNPKANCATPECWGGKLPVLQLDIPEFVDAWNTRPNAPR